MAGRTLHTAPGNIRPVRRDFRRRKLHIPRFRLKAKAHSLRCASSPHRKRCAPLRRGPRRGPDLHTPMRKKRTASKRIPFFFGARGGTFVGASFVSLASAWRRKLPRSAAPPLPTANAALLCGGDPEEGVFFTRPRKPKRNSHLSVTVSFWWR